MTAAKKQKSVATKTRENFESKRKSADRCTVYLFQWWL